MRAREVLKRLKKEGWVVLRIEGSHYQLGKGSKRTTVIMHGSKDLKKGTLRAIERQTGIKFLK